ncbi:ABC transporter ATP-binding protein [Pelagicoccus sp. NFK12]|uniref:ABC transporter ATP-binding protein n=1 Tax=Pelagicoccus enzymogenes TaxID=2773457 RepID=A0A927IH09_9BACT|nr:ABC transporter ATP-binding protein [Pelagicoccus enzymogenes]MBD5778935.1 ABC transporter ATP-binding protein [Pelagicoccus enzymogenes]MDQ8197321.1 ABC transporter ATP-binding protein [Pelagicoccus enzymogenes]
MSESPPLRCEKLQKAFGKRTLFSEIDLELRPRERLALLGASGSGKSTLLHCLSGVMPADSGRVWLAGERIDKLDSNALAQIRRRKIGTVFQFFHLLPTLTARENIELPLQLLGQASPQRNERVSALLERMGISHRADAFPAALSGGEMQRVAIARAIAHRPPVLFADEPTGNLDSRSGESVLQLLKELTDEEGAALLMVTHSDEAASICQRQLHLADGVLRETAHPDASR